MSLSVGKKHNKIELNAVNTERKLKRKSLIIGQEPFRSENSNYTSKKNFTRGRENNFFESSPSVEPTLLALDEIYDISAEKYRFFPLMFVFFSSLVCIT